MKPILIILVSLFFCKCLSAQQKAYTITAYGAKADGVTNNTLAIQKAIDQAALAGGGMVIIPAGKFVTGVLTLKSGVNLHLATNAQLLGSTQRADYGAEHASALITANNQQHIAITGNGVIDGQAIELLKNIYIHLKDGTLQDKEWNVYSPYHQMRPSEANRPKLIEFKNCTNIEVKNVTIKNGLCWVQNYKDCTNITIDSIKVESTTYWNNDGIDLVDCKNVKLTNSTFNAADDGICLKSEDPNGSCENVYIANCTIRSSASAFKLGTGSAGGFKKITVRNIEVFDTFRSAIALESVDGATLEDINISNVVAKNTGNALFIRLGHRNKTTTQGKLRNIYISNVTAEIPSGKPDKGYQTEGPVLKYPHKVFPSSIVGIPGSYVQNVTLEHINITYTGDENPETPPFALDSIDKVFENAAGYPEFSMFGDLPAWGFYIRHARGVNIKDMTLKYIKDELRPACVFDDVDNLGITGLNVPTVKTLPAIALKNVTNSSFKKIKIPGRASATIKKL